MWREEINSNWDRERYNRFSPLVDVNDVNILDVNNVQIEVEWFWDFIPKIQTEWT